MQILDKSFGYWLTDEFIYLRLVPANIFLAALFADLSQSPCACGEILTAFIVNARPSVRICIKICNHDNDNEALGSMMITRRITVRVDRQYTTEIN